MTFLIPLSVCFVCFSWKGDAKVKYKIWVGHNLVCTEDPLEKPHMNTHWQEAIFLQSLWIIDIFIQVFSSFYLAILFVFKSVSMFTSYKLLSQLTNLQPSSPLLIHMHAFCYLHSTHLIWACQTVVKYSLADNMRQSKKSHCAITKWCTRGEWPVNCITVISARWRSHMPFQRWQK